MFKKVILVTDHLHPTYLSPNQHAPNFLSEGVRCGLDKEKERMGHTWCISHSLFGLRGRR